MESINDKQDAFELKVVRNQIRVHAKRFRAAASAGQESFFSLRRSFDFQQQKMYGDMGVRP